MSAVISDERPGNLALSEVEGFRSAGAASAGQPARPSEVLRPNALVRWAFYLSVFTIPFSHIYLPGTGERLGVLRIVQMLMFCGILSQPRICLRFIPRAIFWFLGYFVLRVFWGLWFTPEMSFIWWPRSREFLQFLIPWVWVMFNVLQFPETRRAGLWALVMGCSLCACFHLAGIGVAEVKGSIDERTSVFGLNANEIGATYAVALIVIVGFGTLPAFPPRQRLVTLFLMALIGAAMASTGSRGALLLLVTGLIVLFFQGRSFGSRMRGFAGVVVLGVVLAVILWKIPTVMERFKELDPQNIGKNNPRARMAPVLWEIFLRSPIYGSGPDAYEFELTRRAMPYLIKEQRTIVSHNLALLLLVETGVIGFVIFSVGVAGALAGAWKARHSALGAMPMALLIPFIIDAATVGDPSHHLVFWVALAYSLAGAARPHAVKETQKLSSAF